MLGRCFVILSLAGSLSKRDIVRNTAKEPSSLLRPCYDSPGTMARGEQVQALLIGYLSDTGHYLKPMQDDENVRPPLGTRLFCALNYFFGAAMSK